jgi:uncharacterized protein (TIGR03067 family)
MTDQERIQGTWALVAGERNGNPIAPEMATGISLVFAGDKLTTKTPNGDLQTSFSLNSDKNPTEIDVEMAGQPGRGIYSLDGDDLKIIHGEVGKPRPTQFAAPAGSGLTLLVLRRA